MALITTGASRAYGMLDSEQGALFVGVQLPKLDPVAEAERMATQRLEAELARGQAVAERAMKDAGADVARELGVALPGGIPTSPSQIGKATADAVLKELGIPIPIDLSADGLLKAAGLANVFPFPLPTSLPKSVEEFIEQGLKLAAVQFGPQALAAIGLGSVVPGIGNVIGAAIALINLIGAMMGGRREALSRYWCVSSLPQPYSSTAPPPLPLFMVPYYQNVLFTAVAVTRDEQRMKRIREGVVIQCVSDQRMALRKLWPMINGAPRSATLPDVQQALHMFKVTQDKFPGWKMEREAQNIHSQLTTRLAYLNGLGQEYERIMRHSLGGIVPLSVLLAEISKMEDQLAAEMRIAGVAAQGTQSIEWMFKRNLAQFALATVLLARLKVKQQAAVAAWDKQRARALVRPGAAEAHRRQMERWQREQ